MQAITQVIIPEWRQLDWLRLGELWRLFRMLSNLLDFWGLLGCFLVLVAPFARVFSYLCVVLLLLLLFP